MTSRTLVFPYRASSGGRAESGTRKTQTNDEQPQFYFITSGTAGLRLEHEVDPVYPVMARMARIEGTVFLSVAVEEDGSVSAAKPLSGHPLPIKPACHAVAQWRFAASPQLPTHLRMWMEFRLADSGPLVDDQKYFPDKMYYVTSRSPNYPEEAKRNGIEGQVAFEMTMGPSGEIFDVRILKSDNDLLNSSALDIIQNPPHPGSQTLPALGPGIHRAVVNFKLNQRSLSADGPLPIQGKVLQAPAGLLITDWGLAMYPSDSQRDDVEGDVQVKLTVDHNGEISDAGIVSGPAPFQAAALEASKKWRFAPPSAAPAEVTLNYHFWIPK